MFRTTTIALLSVLVAAPAFAGTAFTATLKEAKTENVRVVAGDVVWLCTGTTCEAELNRKSATVSVCKKVVKEVGAVSAFASEKNALSEEQLAACNASLN